MKKHLTRFMRGAHVLGDLFAAAKFVAAAVGMIVVMMGPVVLAFSSHNMLWFMGYAVYVAIWVYVEGWSKEKKRP